MDLPPEALAYRAQETLKRLGYDENPVHTAYGFDAWDRDYLALLNGRDHASQDSILTSARPAVIGFWYRQHRSEFWTDSFFPVPEIGSDAITYDIPPNTEPGMIRAFLDPKGRLLQLEVRPLPGSANTGSSLETLATGARQLFAEADLDPARFSPVAPISVPPVAEDARMAWAGTFAEDPASMVRVEAAWWQGKPIFFDIRGLWKRDSALYDTASPILPGTSPVYPASVFVTLISVLGGAALVARYNLRLGRGDKKGASQLAGLTFTLSMGYWAFTASHVSAYWELHLVIKALGISAFLSALMAAMYLAIEPAVRRNWPDSLISWTRLQRRQFRDPLTASHVLAGTLVGSVFIALRFARLQLSPAQTPFGFAFTSLNNVATFFGNLMASVVVGLLFGLSFLLVVVIVRLRIRSVWIGDLVASTVLAFGTMGPGSARRASLVIAAVVLGIAMNLSFLWLLRRFGLLAALVAWVLWETCVAAPITLTSWYAGRSLILQAIPIGLAAWAVWVIVTASRRVVMRSEV